MYFFLSRYIHCHKSLHIHISLIVWGFFFYTAVFAPSTVIPGNTRDMRTITVRGLDPGNGYSFRIKAVNALGVGPPCTPSGECALYNVS